MGAVVVVEYRDGLPRQTEISGPGVSNDGAGNVVITGGSGSDKHYAHTQASASTLWTINHSLGKYPSVTIFDSSGSEWVGEVTHTDTNTLTVAFSSAFGGVAYLN